MGEIINGCVDALEMPRVSDRMRDGKGVEARSLRIDGGTSAGRRVSKRQRSHEVTRRRPFHVGRHLRRLPSIGARSLPVRFLRFAAEPDRTPACVPSLLQVREGTSRRPPPPFASRVRVCASARVWVSSRSCRVARERPSGLEWRFQHSSSTARSWTEAPTPVSEHTDARVHVTPTFECGRVGSSRCGVRRPQRERQRPEAQPPTNETSSAEKSETTLKARGYQTIYSVPSDSPTSIVLGLSSPGGVLVWGTSLGRPKSRVRHLARSLVVDRLACPLVSLLGLHWYASETCLCPVGVLLRGGLAAGVPVWPWVERRESRVRQSDEDSSRAEEDGRTRRCAAGEHQGENRPADRRTPWRGRAESTCVGSARMGRI